MVDVIIVGGGVAGLSAALILGRCRRDVLLFDKGEPRNASSRALHGFLSRDGIPPLELLEIARKELEKYTTVKLQHMEIMDAVRIDSGFRVTLNTGDTVECKMLLLATGVADELPEVDGLPEFYGTSIFHCPYCDGWEFSDQPIAIYGRDHRAFGLAMKMLDWSPHLTLCSNGVPELDRDQKEQLTVRKISVIETPIQKFEGENGLLEQIRFQDGSSLPCKALFFALGHKQKSHLPEKLGCEFNDKGCVITSDYESTCVPNLFVAGDASEQLQLAIIAAAEGANAAFAINTALQSTSAAGR